MKLRKLCVVVTLICATTSILMAMDKSPEKQLSPLHNREIESLSHKTDLLEARVKKSDEEEEKLRELYRGLVIATVLASALGSVLSWSVESIASQKAAKTKELQRELARNQSDIQNIETGDSAVRVAEVKGLADSAQLDAANAYEAAGKANERAEQTAQSNLKLKAGLDEEIVRAQVQAETLKRENLSTQTQLQAQIERNQELEIALSPRTLAFLATDKDGIPDTAPLAVFRGLHFIIEFVPDRETFRASQELDRKLQSAGWISVAPLTETTQEAFDGVTVYRYFDRSGNTPSWQTKSGEASKALVHFLKDNRWAASYRDYDPGTLSTDEIKIIVGLRPSPDLDAPMDPR